MPTAKPTAIKLDGTQKQVFRDDVQYPNFYSNVFGIGSTPFDVSIVFAQVGKATQTEIEAVPVVKVTLSPEQVANLVKALTVTLTTYVEGNGLLRHGGALNFEGQTESKPS